MYGLDKNTGLPLYRQLYVAIRNRILSGSFPAGQKLPPTRELAREAGVSRSTVVEAYEQLAAEGYVEARVGDGSYVAPGSSMIGHHRHPAEGRETLPGDRVRARLPLGYRQDLIDFRTGLPDLVSFPIRYWQRLAREALERITPRELAYGQPEGLPELRGAISSYLTARRGLHCSPEQLVIVAGTTQAVGLVTGMLTRPENNRVILEDPVTADIHHIVRRHGGADIPVVVDDSGMRTDLLPESADPVYIYATPSHHFPLGGIMPIQRRIELVDYARRHDCYVLEDDYDTEFRYDGNPVSSIQEIAPERVIYVGSFSKTIFPALRLAFLVLPPSLVERGRTEKWYADLHNPVIQQKTLAAFIARGYFERHIHRTRRKLALRYRATREVLEATFGSSVIIRGAAAGLHLAASFPGIHFDEETIARAETAGIVIYPANVHAHNTSDWSDTLLFGFGMLTEDRVAQGIRILAQLIRPG